MYRYISTNMYTVHSTARGVLDIFPTVHSCTFYMYRYISTSMYTVQRGVVLDIFPTVH